MTKASELNEGLNRLWLKHLPATRSRLEILERALEEIEHGRPPKNLIEEATQAAHNLAGSLGTFGLQSGSAIATEIESHFASGPWSGPKARELRESFGALKREIERKSRS